jgi:hypothetical protein
MQYSMLITPPNLHISSLLAIQNKTKRDKMQTTLLPLLWETRLHLAYTTSLLNP